MTRRRLYIAVAIAAVLAGVAVAIARAWVCDDAFISYRYAEHLVTGKGMVFNAGDRVEGETNLLWTLWTALGLRLGVTAIAWTTLWGIACYAAALALLARRGWETVRDELWPVPAAAIFGAATIAWAEFATSGLETSAFTLLAVVAYCLVCPSDPDRAPRFSLAGLALGVASLLRPDGVVFAVAIGAWLLAGGAGFRGKRALRAGVILAAGVLVIWLPATIWRVAYYGDFVPNTYYAKSADRAWWSQGVTYVWLFAGRYWPLVLAFPLAVAARRRAAIALELTMIGVYTIYIARVGGDFMFARMLVPVVPFLALALERGLAGALAKRRAVHAAAVGVIALALAYMPQAVDGRPPGTSGILDERLFYTQWYEVWADRADHDGAILARMFDGLPVTVGFIGSEARIVYRSRVATAIECETGLTDRVIARQPLTARGRVGHEKHAHLDYLLQRGVEFVFAERAREILELDRYIPDIEVDLGGVKAWVVVWNPSLMAALRERGAIFVDLPAVIDGVIAVLPLLPDDVVRRAYDRLRRSYFDHVKDPAREAPFRARLG